ncbi:hypothetical protein PACTADRAFT_48991 [Pachysolen tannophilus NRRL Y-2460]|uniref:PH-response regulator protein palH/RIM21 n=1 Tax=Pachysolen tannophilus NRRL Y-2460 TaxID=669874 RepID=A0A1E4TZZ5_PACTA|nr:hypothetical protein PACTADRAFT_48991 [Pachysolen tannophilus NRRL Y-2460]
MSKSADTSLFGSDIFSENNCSVYFLPYGTISLYDQFNVSVLSNETIVFPVMYITNCSAERSNEEMMQYYYLLGEQMVQAGSLSSTKDIFGGNLISLAYVYSCILVSSIMLTVLLFLSTNFKPMSLKFTCITFAASCLVIVVKTTNCMRELAMLSLQDSSEFRLEILVSNYYLILNIIIELFVWIAYLDILLYCFSNNKKFQFRIKIAGSILILFHLIFTTLDAFLNKTIGDLTKANAISVINIISQLMLQFLFIIIFISFTLRKLKFSYNLKTFKFSIATLFLIFLPIVFFILANFSKSIRNWSDLFYKFIKVLVCCLIWEWIYDIEVVEKDFEAHGIVGREVDVADILDKDDNDYGKRWKGKFMKNKKSIKKYSYIDIKDKDGIPNDVSIQSTEHDGDEDDEQTQSEITFRSGTTSVMDNHEDELEDELYSNAVLHDDESINNNSIDHNEDQTSLPRFEVHEGFQIGDYWLDEKTETQEGCSNNSGSGSGSGSDNLGSTSNNNSDDIVQTANV